MGWDRKSYLEFSSDTFNTQAVAGPETLRLWIGTTSTTPRISRKSMSSDSKRMRSSQTSLMENFAFHLLRGTSVNQAKELETFAKFASNAKDKKNSRRNRPRKPRRISSRRKSLKHPTPRLHRTPKTSGGSLQTT